MPAALVVAPAPSHETVMEVLAWATGSKKHAVLLGLEESLPCWCLKEHVRRHAEEQISQAASKQSHRIKVTPQDPASRQEAAGAFGKHLALHQTEWLPKKDPPEQYFKLPTVTCRSFMEQLCWSKASVSKLLLYQRKLVKQGYHSWLTVSDGRHKNAGGVANA